MAGVDTHYKLSIRLMQILGLWPYVNTTFRRIQSAVVNCICTGFVTAQITPLTTGELDLTMLLQCVCFVLIFLGSVVKFNTYMAQIGTVRTIMDGIKSTWDTAEGDTLDILRSRANLGKQQGVTYAFFEIFVKNCSYYTLNFVYTCMSVLCMCVTTMRPLVKCFYRYITTIAERSIYRVNFLKHVMMKIFIFPSALLLVVFRTSSYILLVTASPDSNLTDLFPVMTKYFFDKEKYFFFITMHTNLTVFFGATAYVATETLYIMWLQHGTSLLELASYHIKKAVSERPPDVSQEVMEVYRKKCLATAVTYHIEAKVFLTYLHGKFTFSYAVLIVIAVFSLAINFFRLSTAICVTHNVEEMLLASFLSISELTYMFYLNYVMQGVANYADDMPTIIYSTPWYNRSVSVQKNLLIILTSCNDPIVFDFYGFYTASVEGFAGLVKTTVSYFMMITSVQ